MTTTKGATGTKTSLVFSDEGKTVQIKFADGTLSEPKKTKSEIAELIVEHQDEEPQIPISEVESLIDEVIDNSSLESGREFALITSIQIMRRVPSPMDMLMGFMEFLRDEITEVDEPTFVPCPACGKHGWICVPGENRSASLNSKNNAIAWLKTLLKFKKINDDQHKKILAEIGKVEKWREE